VLPINQDEQGTRKTYWYFLTRSYWTGRRYVDVPNTEKKLTSEAEYQNLDEDVKEEEQSIFGNDTLPKNTAVVLRNLCKVYERSNGGLCSKKEQFCAVKDLSYYIEENTLFCFLGPNGAGKVGIVSLN
jgi:ABC-type glutathione transport system ATPase component